MMSKMTNFMRGERWKTRIWQSIDRYEEIQGIVLPDEMKDSVGEFLCRKVDDFIKKGRLTEGFMSISVAALLHIKRMGKK
jgi:hypothetical protein